MGATAELVSSQGVASLAAQAIAARAGVSSSTLHELFDGAEPLLAATFDAAAESMLARIEGACDPAADPRKQVQRTLAALAAWIVVEREQGAVLGLATAVAVPAVAAARSLQTARLARLAAKSGGGWARTAERSTTEALAAAVVISLLEEPGKAPERANALAALLTSAPAR
ncbi:MAG TPA: TetR family transcriptional regulator [Solirubrobacterales bacterium]|nr:TetR family transcriptional regulator [Solirubrobacterales bacterium]